MTHTVTSDDVARVVGDIWSSILGLAVDPADEAPMARPSVTGVVHISGDADGSVSLECPRGLAERAAAVMFGTEVDDLATGEMEDALGELTNMTGGGIKALLPGSNHLSLPTVVEGTGYHLNVPGAVPVRDVWLACDGHLVVVRVYERARVTGRTP